MADSFSPAPLFDPTPEPAAPVRDPDRSLRRLIAAAEVLLCSDVPTQLALGGLLRVVGFDSPVDGEPLPVPFVVALSLGDTVVLVALMVLITRAHGERLRDLWLGPRPPGREALLGLLLVPVLFIGVAILLNFLRLAAPWLHTVPENPLESIAATSVVNALLLGIVAIVAGGVREELQRAFLLVRFEQHLGGPATGVIVVSVVFGLLHIMQGADAVIATGALGAVWAVMYLKRRSVVAPMVSHAGFNALQILTVASLSHEL